MKMKLPQLCRKKGILIIVSISTTIFIIVLIAVLFLLIQIRISQDNQSGKEMDTLKFVQVIFRHGERTTTKSLTFPNDPNINFTYPPYGNDQLTNNGKKQMYETGRYLRQRYDRFLGDYYYTDLLKAISSHPSRSQMSLQLVLAGLFPAKEPQTWEANVKGQSIAYTTTPFEKNNIFLGILCPSYIRAYQEFVNSTEAQLYYQENKDFLDYVSSYSGWNLTTPTPFLWVYQSLQIENLFGLAIPKWMQEIYPEPLRNYAIAGFKYLTSTDRQKRIAVGYLLKLLSTEIYDKINGNVNEKISLYSGHDSNIAAIGATLNLFDYDLIPFAAYILIELHQINNNHILKFYYQDYKQPEPKAVEVRPYGRFITINEYSNLVEKYLPQDDECEEGPDDLELDLNIFCH